VTAIHETAYPRIRSNVTDKELEQIYTPSEDEFLFANQNTQAPVQRLGLLVLLKAFQRVGYFPMLQQIPQRVIHHIATSASLEDIVEHLESYEKVGSRKKHLPKIRAFLSIKGFSHGGLNVMNEALTEACQTKDIIADIINVSIEELVRHRYELPAFSTLFRAARTARSHVNNGFYQSVYDSLAESQKELIVSLLKGNQDDALSEKMTAKPTSFWHRLKQEPKQATTKNMREFIQHLHWLMSLNSGVEALDQIPEAKLQEA